MNYVAGVEDALGVPDSDHVELVVQGFLDTVNGHESYGLSPAQEYLQAALASAGMLRPAEVAGNEGFISSIGNGIAKAWEYIKNFFKGIYNAIFKKKIKDTNEEAKTQIKNTEEVIKQAEKKPSNDEETQRILKAFWKRVEEVKAKDAKEKLEAEMEKLKTQPPAAQAAAVPNMINEIFKAGVEDNEQLTRHAESLKAAVAELNKIKEEIAATDDPSDLADSIQTYLNGLNGLPAVDSITNLASAKAFLQKLGRCQEAMNNNWMSIFNTQQSVMNKIDHVDQQINHWSEGDPKNKELDDKMKELKELLKIINHTTTLNGKVTTAMTGFATTLRKCIVVGK
ncbi:hypothetical protein D3C81_190690 [compost metagenome]